MVWLQETTTWGTGSRPQAEHGFVNPQPMEERCLSNRMIELLACFKLQTPSQQTGQWRLSLGSCRPRIMATSQTCSRSHSHILESKSSLNEVAMLQSADVTHSGLEDYIGQSTIILQRQHFDNEEIADSSIHLNLVSLDVDGFDKPN